MDEIRNTQKRSAIMDKTFALGLIGIKICRLLQKDKEYALANQLIRCSGAVGALVREAQEAQSGKDFINKLQIALKECRETFYWLSLVEESDTMQNETTSKMKELCKECFALLTAIITTKKNNMRIKIQN